MSEIVIDSKWQLKEKVQKQVVIPPQKGKAVHDEHFIHYQLPPNE